MEAELQAFEEARANRRSRIRNNHRSLAEAYLAAHPDDPVFLMCAAMNTIPQLVGLVDQARASGNAETVAKIDVWLECRHEKQHIGGTVDNRPR
jgi:hypothetical protein